MSRTPHIAGRLIFAVAALAATRAAAAEPPTRTITVSAMAEFEVPPTEVVLSLSVVTENEDLMVAKQFNDAFTRDVLNLAAKHHIAKEHFELDTLRISPQYVGGKFSAREVVGYKVTRGIEVTLKNFEQLEPVLADALAAGANHVDGILWRTMDHRRHQFDARRRAVEHAREKATHLAELNGLKLGPAVTIREDVEGRWNRQTGGFGGFGGISSAALPTPSDDHDAEPAAGPFRLAAAPSKLAPPPARERPAPRAPGAAPAGAPRGETVAPGTITVSAEVMITFELLRLGR